MTNVQKIIVLVEPELKDMVEEEARKDHRSLSSFVANVIRKHFGVNNKCECLGAKVQ